MAEKKSLACYYCGVTFSKGLVLRLQDIMSNPGNIGKYQNDPEVMALINKARSGSPRSPLRSVTRERGTHICQTGGAIRRWFPPTRVWEGWGWVGIG